MTYENTGSGSSMNTSVKNIKDDARTLGSDVVDLAQQAKQEARNRMNDAADTARDKVSSLKEAGSAEMEILKNYVTANPGQSMLGAFAAGALLTMILASRR